MTDEPAGLVVVDVTYLRCDAVGDAEEISGDGAGVRGFGSDQVWEQRCRPKSGNPGEQTCGLTDFGRIDLKRRGHAVVFRRFDLSDGYAAALQGGAELP